MSDQISIKDALDDASRTAQIYRDAHKNAAEVERLRASFAEVFAIAEEALRRLGVFEEREESKEIARLRAELAEARRDLTEAIIRESEANRELGREQMRSEVARRERDDALAKLDAMTNQAVMLSGRRSTIVDVSERDAILSEIAHALHIPYASLPSILGAIAGSDTVISQLQAEVKRLREAMPTDEDRDVLDRMYRATVEHVTGGGAFPATPRAEAELAKAREYLARLDAAGGGAK